MEAIEIFAVGANFSTWMRLLIENKFNVSLKRLPQIFFVTLIIVFFTPLGIIEKLLFDQKVKKIELKQDPLFILGHWRQGTTFLHELLVRNPYHEYISLFEAVFPNHFFYFENMIKGIFKLFLPETRPQDDVKIGVDTPYEHDIAIANICSMSPYSGSYFPLNQDYYTRYASLEGLTEKQISKMKYFTEYVLKKLYLKEEEKMLILKSPVDTARVKFLLELFPNAKFVHIYRNPYEVFYSTKKLFERTLPIFSLQGKYLDLENFILKTFRDIYEIYYRDVELIPKGNLIEIKYEHFVKEPLTYIKTIYNELNLKGLDEALPEIKEFLNQEQDYKKSRYNISHAEKQRIYSHWNIIIDRMGYDKPN